MSRELVDNVELRLECFGRAATGLCGDKSEQMDTMKGILNHIVQDAEKISAEGDDEIARSVLNRAFDVTLQSDKFQSLRLPIIAVGAELGFGAPVIKTW